MADPTRREFVAGAALAACECACAGCASVAPEPARAVGPVDVGPLNKFAGDGVYDDWASSNGFFLVSHDRRVYAVSSHCTHRQVVLVAKGAAGFRCPRHGSTFDPDGHVTKSPARQALPRFAVRLDDRGHLVVDASRQYAESDWADPGSFVTDPKRELEIRRQQCKV
jgi:nitrite reductase/ring-hydroxylating ferredoxin subunit